MTTNHAITELRAAILAKMEGVRVPDAVLAALTPLDGKPAGQRAHQAVVDALPDHRVRYQRQYGMVHLYITAPRGEGDREAQEWGFLVGYEVGSRLPVVDIVAFRDSQNTCHYVAATERNALRRELAADDGLVAHLALARARVADATADLAAALDKVDYRVESEVRDILDYPRYPC